MKLLFIACVDLQNVYSGISRKVFSEYNALNQKIDSILIGYCGNGIKVVKGKKEKKYNATKKHRRLMIMDTAVNVAKEERIEYAYIRRMPCNPRVIQLLKELKRNGCKKILWEIPTYPYDHEHDGYKFSLYTKITDKLDILYRKQLKKYIDRIVTFSSEKEIFSIRTINTGNGIDVDSIRVRKVAANTNAINMIAVAVLNDWHGYDRMIEGLANYYNKEKGTRDIFFHIVGDGRCLPKYKEQVERLQIESHVIFYGFKEKNEVEDIYDKCNIAVESLGWHRSKVSMGTSIKTREYVAKGLPIIASTPMDIFPNGWEYAYYAPIDDSPINIKEVIAFFDQIYKNTEASALSNAIRQVAVEKCDMKAMMKPIIDFFIAS